MSNEKAGNAATASRALQPTETNPLDFVPDKIPFDTPYGPPISLDRAQTVIHAAVAEAKKRNWKMNVAWSIPAATSSPFNEWMVRCLPPFRLPSTRHEQPRPSGAKRKSLKTVSSLCISIICSRSTE